MKAAQIILVVILLLALSASAAAQQSPESVVREIYAIHAGELCSDAADRIVNSSDRRNLDRYFDKKLADLIWNDLTMERGEDDTYEVGVVDFDLFYAAQEDFIPISGLKIDQIEIAGDRATVRASFTGGGAKETVEYTLVEKAGAWKIFDIKYRNGMSLLKRFEEATR